MQPGVLGTTTRIPVHRSESGASPQERAGPNPGSSLITFNCNQHIAIDKMYSLHYLLIVSRYQNVYSTCAMD